MSVLAFRDNALELTVDTTAYPDCEPLIERAAALINAGKKPRVEIRGVPVEIQLKPSFKELKERLKRLYRNPVYGFAQCLHESAHAIVMEEDGIPRTIFGGPGIRYNRQTKTLFPYAAKIDPIGEPDQILDESLIFKRALHAAVGSVAIEKYAGVTEQSDDKDYKDFAEKYATMPAALRKEQPIDLWGRAQQKARMRLDNPQTRANIFARIPQYLGLVYR